MMGTELVKIEVAARAIGLSKFFLYRLAAEEKIPCYRAGKALRFSIPELLDWMKNQARKKEGNGEFAP